MGKNKHLLDRALMYDTSMAVGRIRKEGRKRMATLYLKQGQGFFDPAHEFSKVLGKALKEGGENGQVKITVFAIGEMVANLEDLAANRRSIAAILARKYRKEYPKLSQYYSAIRKRELDPEEIDQIMAIVGMA